MLATNGRDTYAFFLYADGLIQWTRDGVQIGIDGGDGMNYFTVPGSLTPEIINITHTSNVNRPGLWIFKLDRHIIAGKCSGMYDMIISCNNLQALPTLLVILWQLMWVQQMLHWSGIYTVVLTTTQAV